MKVFSTKSDPKLDQIEATQAKVDSLKNQITDDLLKPCQWLYPIKDETKNSRVTSMVKNAKRLKECYILNNAKREYLEELRKQK